MTVVRRAMGRPRAQPRALEHHRPVNGSAAGGNRGTPGESTESPPAGVYSPNMVSCSPPRSISGSSPSTGSSQSRLAPSRAASASRCCHLRKCQFWRVHLGAQPRRSVELQAQQLGPLARKDAEAGLLVGRLDLAASPQDDLAEHGGPLDVEHEGHATADVPDRVDGGERLGRGTNDQRQVGAPLVVAQPLEQRGAGVRAVVRVAADPRSQAEPMPVVDQGADDPRVVVLASRQVLLDPQLPLLADGGVGGQAGPHQLLVGRLEAREEGVDPLQEAVLVEPSGRGQNREGGPLDPVRQRRLGQLRVAQPPEGPIGIAESDERRMVVARQLLAQQRRQQVRPALRSRRRLLLGGGASASAGSALRRRAARRRDAGQQAGALAARPAPPPRSGPGRPARHARFSRFVAARSIAAASSG